MEKVTPILLVDDDPVNNFLSYAVFKRLGISQEIQIENNGHNALLFLRDYYAKNRSLPPLIFLDINMPVMDGFEFLCRFNKEFSLLRDKVEIVILTEVIDERVLAAGKALRVTHFILKPLSTDIVEKLFQNLLNVEGEKRNEQDFNKRRTQAA